MRAAVEQVIQTASKVLEGTLETHEAVTILATLARDAVPAAIELRQSDPERAATYGELLEAMCLELERQAGGEERSPQVEAVVEDLSRVQQSLV